MTSTKEGKKESATSIMTRDLRFSFQGGLVNIQSSQRRRHRLTNRTDSRDSETKAR